MNREIKFRAKNTINGNWVYGYYFKEDGINKIHSGHTIYPVHPQTVSELTGLKDKNGKEIYEGDIVLAIQNYHGEETNYKFNAVIVYNGYIGSFQISYKNINGDFVNDYFALNKYFVNVIGNIYENPELLK